MDSNYFRVHLGGGHQLNKADGLGIEDLDSTLEIKAAENCEFFIFRLSENK